MGYKLRREVRDLLWAGALTASERVLLLELADNANDDTRVAYPGMGWILAACDIPSKKRAGEHLASIAAKWFEIRVEVGKDKNGNALYAMPKIQTRYRFPTRDELVARHGERKVPKIQGLDACKVPENQGPKVPENQGADGPKAPDFQGPFSSKNFSPQSSNSSPPPTPSLFGTDHVVIDAEIVEEAEEIDASPETQLQNLTDQIRAIRPNWNPAEIRRHLDAALRLVDENFEALTTLAVNTAKDRSTAQPSRLTASGNPHLQRVGLALLVARADAMPDTGPIKPLHPNAHVFQPKTDGSKVCGWNECELPEANDRHRVGNRDGGYVGQTRSSHTDGLDEYGNGFRKGGTRHHLTDSRAPNRDYSEPL
ncbi:hypothetical protein FHR83_006810 [Actinoplanes campanulatus]|uniref:Helix-turn-helix domain-containing protein n=1 Tax=Actinoplanes campanulatus TaxID=113559 RepID=A0A7W5ANN0_9ACTN|nr:hypothetical protein [Actinoplanes campanulatus]MBB3099104.1 hypothetical protein [Actinoplanes campanulatus]GGN39033.1 hypothetical protein GCM10010109_66490 [Actinoplanes campanulatus]GID40260.1 hypothetical protein Aca09nite_67660 [Actinoplanes campanulatus]